MSTGELLDAWRDASRAAELAEHLAAAALRAADRAERDAATAQEVATLAEDVAASAARAAAVAREGARRAQEQAAELRTDVGGANVIADAAYRTESTASGAYHAAEDEARRRHEGTTG